uniref:hypothetical protein n=1 Tax=Pseudomonas aeruginosa TaxID=287 RepID=UPI0026E0F341
ICCHPFEDDSLNYPVVTVSKGGSTIEIALDQALERNPHQLQINMEPGHKPTPSIAQLLEQSAGDRLVVNEEAIRAARNPK